MIVRLVATKTFVSKMSQRLSSEDLIPQRTSSIVDESYSLAMGSTFTLQDRVEAIEHSSEEFYEKVSKKATVLYVV